MARVAAPWPLKLSDALALLNVDGLRHLIDRLDTPKPRPTRKADMVRVVSSRLRGDSLRRLWDRLGDLQKAAVSEVLHGPEPGFNPKQFKAKYGALPADLGSEVPRGAVPLRLFLYPRGPLQERAGDHPRGPRGASARLRAAARGGDARRRGRSAGNRRAAPAALCPRRQEADIRSRRARTSRHGTLGVAGPVHRDAPRRPRPGRGERHHAATLGRRRCSASPKLWTEATSTTRA